MYGENFNLQPLVFNKLVYLIAGIHSFALNQGLFKTFYINFSKNLIINFWHHVNSNFVLCACKIAFMHIKIL